MTNGNYQRGFTAGWLAASRALCEAVAVEIGSAPSLEMAGNLPGTERRRRGRPPKSASMVQSAMQAPKRRRGRPRKNP
jgi:hypothetical protein